MAELWVMLWDLVEEKGIALSALKATAHALEDPRRLEGKADEPWQIRGNALADVLAGWGAAEYGVTPEDVEWASARVRLVEAVQRRLVAILDDVLRVSASRPKGRHDRVAARAAVADAHAAAQRDLEALAARSAHWAVRQGKGWRCLRCLGGCEGGGDREVVVRWLDGVCGAVGGRMMGRDRGCWAVPEGWCVQRPGGRVHASHRLIARGGLVVCRMCGGVSALRRRKLLKQCSGVLPAAGQENVLRVLDGRLPLGVPFWPVEDEGLELEPSASHAGRMP